MLQDGFAKRIGGGQFTGRLVPVRRLIFCPVLTCPGRVTRDVPDIYRVREKKDVFVLKLLKVNLEGSGTARAEFDSEARILAQLQARIHPGMGMVA